MEVRQRLCALGDRSEARKAFEFIRGKKGEPTELFDLSTVVPVPRAIRALEKLTSPEMTAAARATPEAIKRHTERVQIAASRSWLATGFDSASEWLENYWGTPKNVWGVERCETMRKGEPDVRLFFYSYKRPIYAVVRELSCRFTNVMFELTFADEVEEFVGVAHYVAGKGLGKEADWCSEHAEMLRARLWEHPEDDIVQEAMMVS